ncbi:MAG TPA: hypothetical protein VNB54_01140 [Alphaproteobacteria bacterium]|nr:hypothetical protein [Alphaproteobacteria bacterium]
MADQEKDKQMETQTDDMLDSLLANYSSAEPRPGLETRIMANLRDAESSEAGRGWWGFKWLWAGAAVAALIVAGVILLGVHRKEKVPVVVHELPTPVRPQPQQPQQKPPEIAPQMATKRREHSSHRAAMIPAAQNAGLKPGLRPANFPTPFPLSEQERLMLAYLNNTPHQEVIAQIQRTDQQEADEFWDDRNGFTRKPVTR